MRDVIIMFIIDLDIDECRDGSNQCQFDELCRDNDGSYTCRCPSGYTLEADGHRCKGNT